jgi:spore germination protein KA
MRAEIEKRFKNCSDFISREIVFENKTVFICFLRGMADRSYISREMIAPITENGGKDPLSHILRSVTATVPKDVSEAVNAVLDGQVLIICGNECVISNAAATVKRSVTEPDTDITVRGPKVGFTEDWEINLALIRRCIKSENLKSVPVVMGNVTATRVAVVWIEGRAEKGMAENVISILKENKDITGLTDSGNLETLIAGNGMLPKFGNSEKADKVISKIIAGRVAVICDGSPFVLTAPYVFAEALQSSDDYYRSPVYATFIRSLRFFSMIISLLLPALFCAAWYHAPNALPETIRLSLEDYSSKLPMPLWAEVFAALTVFELLREVGVRMPQRLGDAVGIVGSLILGEAAVSAGLIAPTTVMVVALSEVTAFIVPVYMYSAVIVRYTLLAAGCLTGFAGVFGFISVIFCVLCATESFGKPYMAPLAPFSKKGMADYIIAFPGKTVFRREKL